MAERLVKLWIHSDDDPSEVDWQAWLPKGITVEHAEVVPRFGVNRLWRKPGCPRACFYTDVRYAGSYKAARPVVETINSCWL